MGKAAPGLAASRGRPYCAPVHPSPADILRSIPMFASLPEADLHALIPLLREKQAGKGGMILMQGDRGEALFLVASGQVKVVLIGEDGREVILSVLGPGAFFGELALLDDEPRSAHVVAMEDTVLYHLRREDFQGRLRTSPDAAIAVLRELSRRLRRANTAIGSLALRDVAGRVAHLLLDLAAEEGGTRITRRLTHATIAQMVGASRETVSRALSDFAAAGMLRLSRREILLLDRPALAAAADQD